MWKTYRASQACVAIEEGGQAYVGRYAASTDGLVRIDIYVDGTRVYSEGIDEVGTWMRSGDGPSEQSQATGARNALLHGAEDHLYGWHRFGERGHQLRLLGKETIEGEDYPVVEVRYATGHVTYYYLDTDNWLVARKRDERAYHPDIDPTEIEVETRYQSHGTVEDVQFSDRSIDIDRGSGETLSTNTVLGRWLNPELCETYFSRDRLGPATLEEENDDSC